MNICYEITWSDPKTIILGIICGGLGTGLFIYGFWYFTIGNHQDIDMMSPENLCRPVPDNYRICGSGILNQDGTRSEYRYLALANGNKILTDCKSDEYPFTMKEYEYSCADGIIKEIKH